jgi:predicted RNase H-like HicB family nuclease
MKQEFSAVLWQEGEWVVAQCLEVDVASQGRTEEEALANLREALELHFTPPRATVMPTVRSLEMDLCAA